MDGTASQSPPWLHTVWPEDMRGDLSLPGVRPVTGPWLRVDEAYAGQMAERERLLSGHRDEVLWSPAGALAPGQELLEMVCAELPALGFRADGAAWHCPDGRIVNVDRADPLGTLGRLVQCDLCLLDRVGEEHILGAAVLCFPASWTLAQKAGKPLIRIHKPVEEYDAQMARRVQRLFDGVQPGRPLWRFNRLTYADPALFHPRREGDQHRAGNVQTAWLRTERQTILRLPRTGWVLFAIHTYLLRASDHLSAD